MTSANLRRLTKLETQTSMPDGPTRAYLVCAHDAASLRQLLDNARMAGAVRQGDRVMAIDCWLRDRPLPAARWITDEDLNDDLLRDAEASLRAQRTPEENEELRKSPPAYQLTDDELFRAMTTVLT